VAEYTEYRIYPALYEEATEGWVWLAGDGLEPHRLLELINKDNGRKVVCECRILDRNFICRYNNQYPARMIDANDSKDVLVIGDWYRGALGMLHSASAANLKILQLRNPVWQALRVGSQHPNPGVRLGNRLGVLGTWLGFSGFVIAIAQEHWKTYVWIAEVSLAALGIAALLACRGVRR
jgi:hypothetical protein